MNPTMKKYFFGDTIARWAVRLGMFALLPVSLTAVLRWYTHGLDSEVALRLKIFGVLFLLSAAFLVIAIVKGERMSTRKLKHSRKSQ
ncbi:hypothetical protein [Pseudomonas syringae]|uniref:Uncharacterized protein n=1 Tax=Pseudomonas syringae TaxID=317 RepID=A0AB38C104_PSESX|nr:hypothetical protein [Pseudomonas syringae]RMO51677.1 hypothetical protein ALQ40_200103 [Pseudomonas syringae]SFO53334.1 hypothetical protein SAMN05444065_12917 [Pseudomonas syringae]SFO92086.1 hypothetical protein SAMN05444063_12885 [Pseudomonas syringae]